MFEQIKNYMFKGVVYARKKANTFSFASKSMKYISLYALLLVLCCLLYLAGWGFIWYFTGNPSLDQLLKFIHEIASASWIAVIGFIAQGFVDRNNNGIPDHLEQEQEEKDKKSAPRKEIMPKHDET